MKDILVKNLMTEIVSCIPPDAPIQSAINQMVEHKYSCIVIKQNNLPIGIVTERDLVKILNQNIKSIDLSLPISDFMTSPILSINENESLFDAMVISRAERIRHLPIVNDDEHLVGLVTQSDLANAHFQMVEIQSELIEKTVSAKTDDLQQLNDELQKLSMEDHLMKIGNRRSMEVDLGHTHTASIRHGHLYSLLLMDIDFFKLYNDCYGRQAGDEALQSVAEILKENIRDSDRLYRYGGEELLLVLPYTDTEQAKNVAHKLVSAIEKKAILHEKSSYQILTISCGGACILDKGQMIGTWKKLVELVDRNLYQAKNSGRDCSIVT